MATRYQHHPIDRDCRQIRLLSLEDPGSSPYRWILKTFDLNSCPQFKALSYTWGADAPVQTISIDGLTFEIRQNLWDFLELWWNSFEWLWVDAICIDQASIQERNHQVSFMDAIYRDAEEVLVWLGPESDDSAMAIDFVRLKGPCPMCGAFERCEQFKRSDERKKSWMERDRRGQSAADPTLRLRGAIAALFRRPYWSRVWIIQEIWNAKVLTVFCGKSSLSWMDMSGIAGSFLDYHLQFHGFSHLHGLADLILVHTRNVVRTKRFSKTPRRDGMPPTMIEIVEISKDSQCSDIRDRVFAVNGLLQSHKRVRINYDVKPQQLLFDVIRLAVKTEGSMLGKKTLLRFAESLRQGLQVTECSQEEVESFVKDQFQEFESIEMPAYQATW